jgi:hypothetical protein
MPTIQAENCDYGWALPKISLPLLEISAAMFSDRNTPVPLRSHHADGTAQALPPPTRFV